MSGNEISSYCRDIETYLCQKNDGHLVRVVGPSFEVVSRWSADGIPLKVACAGIDRYFERYYRKGPRRRPVRVEFCDADVRDAFDEWRRALGLAADRASDAPQPADEGEKPERKGPSLAGHVERVLLRLTQARAQGILGAEADGLLDRVSAELDVTRRTARGLRGEARMAVIRRLAELDAEVLQIARNSVPSTAIIELERLSDAELADYRAQMPPERLARARALAVARLLRERLALPIIAFE